jgi:nicotinate dehydrogenase subunit B
VVHRDEEWRMSSGEGTSLRVNTKDVVLDGDGGTPLLVALREQLDLRAVRPGCAVGECGACTVLIDGVPAQSCQTSVGEAAGRSVTTPEGLRTPEGDHPALTAFLDLEAAQCGYCVNGIMMRVAGIADRADRPTDLAGLAAALEGQLCRCGTHARLLEAAARVVLGDGAPVVSTCELRRCDACVPDVHAAPAADVLPELVQGAPDVSDWLRITDEGRVEVLTGRSEIGQAVHTALRQIVAAHLGLSTSLVDVVAPTTSRSRNEGFTAGSRSVMEGGQALAMAATALRRLALERAGARLGRAVEALKVGDDGTILGDDAEPLALADLVAGEAGPITGAITPGDAPDWGLAGLGAPERRHDLEAKLTGPAFLHDLDLPGMVHAKLVLPPSVHATLVSTDVDAVRAIDGVVEVVHDGRLLMVIAERESVALRAAAALEGRTRWEDPGLGLSAGVLETMRGQPSKPHVTRQDEGVDEALAEGTRVAATYTRPYQSHGSMSPSAGVAWLQDGHLEVWAHTQGVFQLRKEIAALLGGKVAGVTVHHADGPGSYGQNAADDAAALAALAALAVPGRPVRLHLSVGDEFHWEPYGTAMAADLEASVDGDGRILAWRHRTLTDGHMNRPSGQGDRTIAAWLPEGGAVPPKPAVTEGGARNIVPIYALPRVEGIADHVTGPLRSGSLRSLGSFHNVFAQESFMDEVAEAAGKDPVAFRLEHLDDQRAREVLEAATEAAGWQPHVGPSGRGMGVALARYHDHMGFAAVVAEVEVDVDAGVLAVRRLTIASDLGTVVNPEGARQQLEGGALQGVSRTLFEELRVDRRAVRTDSWETYPVLRFPDVPRIDLILLDRHGAPPLGAGEVTTPPVPAAIANAIDDATGIRLRDLPITLDALRDRVLGMDEGELARVLLG